MWILRAVAPSIFGGAAHRDVSRVDASERALRARRIGEDRIERGVRRAMEAAEGIASEIRVLIDTSGDERMRDL